MDVEALYAYDRFHIVVDHPYSHFKASNRAGNDGRSVHDLDLHGHERDAKRASEAVLLHPFPTSLFYGYIS